MSFLTTAAVPIALSLSLALLSATNSEAWQQQQLKPLSRRHSTAFYLPQLWATPDNNNDSGGWSVADDWNALSSENPHNSAPDSDTIFNQDIASNAAQSILPDNHGEEFAEEDDTWLKDVIEDILQTPLDVSTPLYDTSTTFKQQKTMEDQMAEEIAMLVRCNESPEEMLVRAGRAVPELTVAQKQDVAQLVVWKKHTSDNNNDQDDVEGHWESTPFFSKAIAKIFDTHAISRSTTTTTTSDNNKNDNNKQESCIKIMDAKAISRWMTRSIGEELDSYTEKQKMGKDLTTTNRQKKRVKIGPHDSRVLKLLTQYSKYGTGYLTLENMEQLYLEALTLASNNNNKKQQQLSSYELLKWYNADHIRQVWRDLTNHGIVSPMEQDWNQERAKLQEEYGSVQEQTKTLLEGDFVDECEILEETSSYQPPPTEQQLHEEGYDAKNFKYIKKSSYEQVQLADDGKTPLYMNEGEFVFIDEESCVGCMQCVNAAPASFLMLENGRARTFHQRHGPDVRQGVAACPVNCMHFVSYDELKELETVRDKGDGRDDHRHMGHRRGHTPLYVAGIDSDNNHRSSWYHHIKNKCDSSGQCPKRGCFDCPAYRASGENPYFQQKAKESQHIRAQQFMDNGDADLWRKVADL